MTESETTVATTGTFIADGERWRFTGSLTFDDAADVLEASEALPLPKSGVVDMTGLTHADSAALAVLLALKRRGAAERKSLTFADLPPVLDSLARVYGIEELIAPGREPQIIAPERET